MDKKKKVCEHLVFILGLGHRAQQLKAHVFAMPGSVLQ